MLGGSNKKELMQTDGNSKRLQTEEGLENVNDL